MEKIKFFKIKINLNNLQKVSRAYIYFGSVNAHGNLKISTRGHHEKHKELTDVSHTAIAMVLRRNKASQNQSICILPIRAAAALA